jgi:hypothetical protein
VALNIGILQIVVPIVFAIAAAPLTGRIGLRYLGGTLIAVAAVNFVVRFATKRSYRDRRWPLLSCTVVGVLTLGASFLPPRFVRTTPKPVPMVLPSATATSGGGPAFSYLDKATAPGQDIDLGFNYRGYVRQTFSASGTRITSVAVIVSRDATALPGYDPKAIGHVLLTLWRIDKDNNKTAQVPLSPVDGRREETAEVKGISAMAGPNHSDTVIEFAPVATTPGERLAFEVSNVESGVVLSFSLRPTGSAANPVFWDNSLNPAQAPGGRINRAVSGYVCNVSPGC